MAFDIDMIGKVYESIPSRIAAARAVLGKPLTIWILSGLAIGPIILFTSAIISLRKLFFGMTIFSAINDHRAL